MSYLRKIELFYDVVSPYSYFAFATVLRYSCQHNIELSLRPFYLGGVMGASGNKPPGQVPAKARYMFADLNKLQEYFDVQPLKMPSRFPINSLNAQRLLTALSLDGRDAEEKSVAMKLWEFYWCQDRDISDLETLKQVLEVSRIKPEETQSYLDQIASDKVKETLKQRTEEAVKRGAFGSPTLFIFSVDGKKEEMFFGSDRFHILFPMIGVTWTGPNPREAKM